jgi:hypothetical protein
MHARRLPALVGFALLVTFFACTASQDGASPSNRSPTRPDASDLEDAGDDSGLYVPVLPAWLASASVVANGHAADDIALDCRTVICRHNEDTDMTTFNGAVFFVHRTAISQTLGPNSALHVYKSTDGGLTFAQTALIPAPVDRDIRDPHFFEVNGVLHLKALTRVPTDEIDSGDGERDTGVDTISVGMQSTDGTIWTAMTPIGPPGWSFWRIKKQGDTYYTAAYQDGDLSVVLYSSPDGVTWTAGAQIYGVSADTPLETELTFMPSGRMLALVRMDGTDAELLGDQGRLRTKTCWAEAPYTTFDCSTEFDGQRLDGPLSFFWNSRLFVVGRKHLQGTGRKRTSLYEITGTLEGGPIAIDEIGEFPSAGDTSYAGVAMIDGTHALVGWYSGDIPEDEVWALGMFAVTDVWKGTIDLSKL